MLNQKEIDLYDEFLEPSETRFSKTNIFVNYKEFHNRRNIQETTIRNKTFFRKQLTIINKEKKIRKPMPGWASDIDLLQKIQVIQTKLEDKNLLIDELNFRSS